MRGRGALRSLRRAGPPVLGAVGRGGRPPAGPAGRPAVVLRRGRAGHRHRRAGPRPLRRAGLRPPPDRPQPPRRGDARGRGARSSSRSSTRCPTGATVVFSAHGVAPAVRADAGRPRPAGHRRHLPAGRQGPPRGPPVRRRGLPRRAASATPATTRSSAPSARRPTRSTSSSDSDDVDRSADPPTPAAVAYLTQTTLATDEAAEHRRRPPATASRPRRARRATTSATPPRTARTRCGPSPAPATWCSSSGRRNSSNSTRLVEVAAPAGLPGRPRSRTRPSSTWPGWPAPPPSASPPARRRPSPRRTGSSTPLGALGPVEVEERPVTDRTRPLPPSPGGPLNAHPLAPEHAGSAPTCSARSWPAGSKFPLIVELEPLFACNLAARAAARSSTRPTSCASGSSVEDAVAAMEECGAPMVSIAGGEPLLHPDIDRMIARAAQAEDLRLPLHQRRAAEAQARPVHAVAVLLLGRPHRRPAGAPRRRRLPRRRLRRGGRRHQGRQGRGASRSRPTPPSSTPTRRRRCATCSTSSTTTSRSTP